MKKKIITGAAIVILIASTAFKLLNNKEAVAEKVYRPDGKRKILVQADTIENKSLDRHFNYTGTFAPVREVMLVPQIAGEVTGIYFNEGDFVKAGKRLVQVDDELLQTQFGSAEVNYLIAKRNLERYEKSSEGGGVSAIQLDTYRQNLKSAESQWKQLAKQIELCSIEAPFSGTITYRNAELGSLAGGTAVARVTDLSSVKLEITVPEKEIHLFKTGQTASIRTDVFPLRAFTGTIEYVADRGDEAHNYVVRITVKNNDQENLLKAGMYGTAVLKKGKGSALAISRAALIGSAKNPQVFVVVDGKAVLRSIEVGQSAGETVEVVNGLQAGDIVVLSGHINLAEGSPVEVVK